MKVIKKILCAGSIAAAATVTVPAFSFINTTEVFAAQDTTVPKDVVGIKNNGKVSGIKINIKTGYYKQYAAIPTWGEYAYGTAGCAWFASARVRQLTGKGYSIYGGYNWYNNQYKNFGFTRGSVPRAKSLACFEGHVGFVEKVSGNKMVISEGGNWYHSDAKHGYCVIRTTDIKQYENNMGSKFLGYVYLDGKKATTTTSTQKPKNKWVRNAKTGTFSYYGSNGKKYTGWKWMSEKEGEKTPHMSYFGSDGVLRTGWVYLGKGTKNPDGDSTPHWSYFGDNGWLRTGWKQMGTKENPDGKNKVHWSYFGNNGWLRTGLQKMGTKANPDNGNKTHYSYFGDNGWMVTGKVKIKGKTYTFDEKGWRV